MTVEKLNVNFEKLLAVIPKKPEVYTPDYPLNVAECFHKYLRRRAVISISNSAVCYEIEGWPLPLYINPKNPKIGINNSFVAWKWKMYKIKKPHFDWLSLPMLSTVGVNNENKKQILFAKSVMSIFDANINEIEIHFKKRSFFGSHSFQLDNLISCYKKGYWSACICTTFPLLDLVIRKYFKTNKLDKDITTIIGVFKKAGFTLDEIDDLKPNRAINKVIDEILTGSKVVNEINNPKVMKYFDFGLIGIALSSFLYFSNYYYSWFRSDKIELNILNRHAIIHGASNSYYTRENCVKLLTFFYLTLELEPVLEILLKEE